jgi:hypothetical protein
MHTHTHIEINFVVFEMEKSTSVSSVVWKSVKACYLEWMTRKKEGGKRAVRLFTYPFFAKELTELERERERRKRLNSGKEMYSKAGNRVDDENYTARNEKFINSRSAATLKSLVSTLSL